MQHVSRASVWSWFSKMTWITQIFILTLLLFVFMQPLTVDIHYYYILELSFYLSLLFSQFTDIRRKVRHPAADMHHAFLIKRIIECLLKDRPNGEKGQAGSLFCVETREFSSICAIVSSAVTEKTSLSLPDRPSLLLLSGSIMWSLFACEHLLSASVYSHWCVK